MNTQSSGDRGDEKAKRRMPPKDSVNQREHKPLERLRSASDERLEQLRMQRVERHVTDLFNPLAEAKAALLPSPEYPFQEGVRRMLETDLRAGIFKQLLLAIDPTKAPESHAPVIPLGLLVVSADTFVALLPWVRSSFAANEVVPITLEAKVWGRSLPKGLEIQGFVESYAHLGASGSVSGALRISAARALIQRDGLIQLEVALHKAMERLYALNPHSVWQSQNVIDVGGQVAGRAYVQSVGPYIPQRFQGVLEDLAAIMWNRDCIAARDERVTGQSLSPFECAALSLRAAVLNHANAEVLGQLSKTINLCTNSRSTNTQITSGLKAIFSAIELDASSPHGRFLDVVVRGARSATFGSTGLLKKAWLSIATDCKDSALYDLSCLESLVVGGITPKQAPLRLVTDTITRHTLATVLSEYATVMRNSLPLQVVTCQGSFKFAWSKNNDDRTLNASDIAALQPISRILAGVPRIERQRLLNAYG